MNSTKSVTFTLPKDIAERIALVRKYKHRKLPIADRMENAIIAELESLESQLKIEKDDWKHTKTCPKCSSGTLTRTRVKNKDVVRVFLGCNRFPLCRHSESLSK